MRKQNDTTQEAGDASETLTKSTHLRASSRNRTQMQELPPLSPMAQLLYDITEIIEAGVRSAGRDPYEATEQGGTRSEGDRSSRCEDFECTFDESTMTMRITEKRPEKQPTKAC